MIINRACNKVYNRSPTPSVGDWTQALHVLGKCSATQLDLGHHVFSSGWGAVEQGLSLQPRPASNSWSSSLSFPSAEITGRCYPWDCLVLAVISPHFRNVTHGYRAVQPISRTFHLTKSILYTIKRFFFLPTTSPCHTILLPTSMGSYSRNSMRAIRRNSLFVNDLFHLV